MKVNEILFPLQQIVRKAIPGSDADVFMMRFSQLMVPVLFSGQQEVALALRAYLLWGDMPELSNRLLAVAFEELRMLADDLILKNVNTSFER